ncbi:zinc ribbon domain-containing protein [Stygiolobus caldivivus]|uniref:Zinc ribbon domain-containing protein n=1 Tax=Stygiolobus caldivivus TaxID=2824673 RepID=A0A8D5U970_9CREN|nr:zinc ribbon domain-containing protein [Stygiolobus caldivivus]BCU71046.1 zinc ribbon domain-containing protein [Stygiolobus caldivivus]
MQKIYTGRYVNVPLLVQEINNMFLSEGWESQIQQLSMGMMQPGMPQYFDYEIRAMKKGHMHHVETVIVRVKGMPNDFTVIVEEEHIGPLGRELINRRLFGNIDKQITDGLFDMQMPMGGQMGMSTGMQQPMAPQMMGQPAPQAPMPPAQAGQVRCPQCGNMNPPGAKFCLNCGAKLM